MSDPSSPLPASISKENTAKKPSKSSRKPRLVQLRRWLRSRPGRVIIPLVALLLGIVVGISSLFVYGLKGDGKVLPTPVPGNAAITVEAHKAFINSLVTANLISAGMPGTIQNVQLDLANGDQMTITGDDAFSLLGIGLTKSFTIVVQPYINNCSLQIHVLHADLSSIPVTGFTPVFESSINQQLQEKPAGLPQGFQYCATGVSTQPDGMLLTYSAI